MQKRALCAHVEYKQEAAAAVRSRPSYLDFHCHRDREREEEGVAREL